MKVNSSHSIIAREGWLFIALSLVVTLMVGYYVGFYATIPFILITVFILQFFRDPKRSIPNQTNIILAPADGRVICVEECIDPYQNVLANKISIFMNVFNVHSNRSPIDSTVIDIQYTPGKFLNADFDKASLENERNALILKLANDEKITLVQVAGLIARRILCYTKVGDNLKAGERYGFIRFGSRVDIYLPLHFKIEVAIGDKVKASSMIIASFN